jgi:hypothetical protein
MNKCDQLSPNEQNAKENNLRETLKKENISIKGVIRFSEKYPIDVIMKAVESIDCKKDNDEVSQILEDLYGLYDTVNQEYKEWLESLSTQKRNLEITEENIQDYFEQYEEDAKIVGEMPQHESHIFSRDCYEISEADYYEFRGRCQRMLDNREPFETEITDLKDFSKNVTEVEEIVSNIKKQRKMLQDYEKKIIDAVKKFDRNYNIPVHVVSSNNEKNQDKTYSSQTKQDNTSSNDSVSSSSSRLRPVKTGMGLVEDLRAFKKKSHEDFLLKSDILYLAKQYGVSETMALTLALNVTNKII